MEGDAVRRGQWPPYAPDRQHAASRRAAGVQRTLRHASTRMGGPAPASGRHRPRQRPGRARAGVSAAPAAPCAQGTAPTPSRCHPGAAGLMPTRRCLEPTCSERIRVQPGHRTPSRCPAHQRVVDQAKRQRRPHTYAEDQRRAAAVAAHVAVHGWWCPGWGDRPAHPSMDLTADHIIPVGAGGPEDGPLLVRCRPCNSARGAKGDRPSKSADRTWAGGSLAQVESRLHSPAPLEHGPVVA